MNCLFSSYPFPKKSFSENKNIEIQNFEPPKMGQAYVYLKIPGYPPRNIYLEFTHYILNTMKYMCRSKNSELLTLLLVNIIAIAVTEYQQSQHNYRIKHTVMYY